MGSFVSLGGIILLALPITIIGNNFQNFYMTSQTQKKNKQAARQSMAVSRTASRRRSGQGSVSSVTDAIGSARRSLGRRESFQKFLTARGRTGSADRNSSSGTISRLQEQAAKLQGNAEKEQDESSNVTQEDTAKETVSNLEQSPPVSNIKPTNSVVDNSESTRSKSQLFEIERRLYMQEDKILDVQSTLREMQGMLEQLCVQNGVMLRGPAGSGRNHSSKSKHKR